MEEERKLTYEALLMHASDRWATVDEIEDTVGVGGLEPVMDGLVHLRELEMMVFDDGVPCYRLTYFGRRFAEMMILT